MTESILRKVKCPVCGRKLLPAKRQSHKAGKRYVGYCFNDSHPRLKFLVTDTTKNHDDPDADKFAEIQIKDSDW